ncbi:ATP-binding protein [Streptomyces sp. NPDC058257]|uniref:ATP-binding protein n=1 Tax=Streptomyces sp. NPDC058257 TaxID=3346409 RepID=UPI0036E46F59
MPTSDVLSVPNGSHAQHVTQDSLYKAGQHQDGHRTYGRDHCSAEPAHRAEHITAELAANAALHGRVPGRDFRLTLTLALDATRNLRIAVTDALGDRHPRIPDPAGGHAETGRGLVIVAAFADRWGVEEGPGPCKTVWAEVSLLPEPGRGRA